jgi:predicted AAA+ superfamily ATPase
MPPSPDSLPYLTRHLEGALAEALADTPVVCILGPRQCGKSTLARHAAPDRTYISLDDPNSYQLARLDPKGFIGELPEYVTIDEVQRVPELTLAIKQSVDANRKPGRFLLTGSADLLQLPRLSDSLAGRMEWIELQPFSEAEKEGTDGYFLEQWLNGKLKTEIMDSAPPQASTLPKRVIAGGYPEAYRRQPARARQWQAQYIRSIIERDIHDISQVRNGEEVGRFLEYISHQTAQLLNVTETAKALGHTRATVEKYLSILEKLYLLRSLPAWHRNAQKRLVKSPKIHIRDSGLAATLAGITEDAWTNDRGPFGHLLESFIVQQISIQAGRLQPKTRLWHYRDKDKLEVDCVLTQGRRTWGVEVKAAASIDSSDSKGLRRLAQQAGSDFAGGIVLYDGVSILPIDRELKLYAVPISKLWDKP